MENSEDIIFSNSLIRPVIINKEEFYLCYQHSDIHLTKIYQNLNDDNDDNDDNLNLVKLFKDITNNDLNLGKIELFAKKPEGNKYLKYSMQNESK